MSTTPLNGIQAELLKRQQPPPQEPNLLMRLIRLLTGQTGAERERDQLQAPDNIVGPRG